MILHFKIGLDKMKFLLTPSLMKIENYKKANPF